MFAHSPERGPENEAGLEHADVHRRRRLGHALVEQRRAERRQRRRADAVQDLRHDEHVLFTKETLSKSQSAASNRTDCGLLSSTVTLAAVIGKTEATDRFNRQPLSET